MTHEHMRLIRDAYHDLEVAYREAVDTTSFDAALGRLEGYIHDARLEIDDEWRALRAASRRAVRPPARSPTFENTLEDLA